MNISQVIFKLQQLKEQYGDLDCYLPSNATEKGSIPLEVFFVEKIESNRSEYIIIT